MKADGEVKPFWKPSFLLEERTGHIASCASALAMEQGGRQGFCTLRPLMIHSVLESLSIVAAFGIQT